MARAFMSDIKNLIPDQARQDQALIDHNNDPGAHPGLGAEVLTYGASIAGTGNVWTDVNATDFTGHPYAVGAALEIRANAVVTFGHNNISYLWQGPRGVTVGVGGTHVSIQADYSVMGTNDHALLNNREIADAHPTAAVTGLDAKQASQDTAISNNTSAISAHVGRTDNPHSVTHAQMPDVGPDPSDPHPQYVQKKPIMALGGTIDSFTLNTTDSKLVNYTESGEEYTSGSVNPTTGEITIPEDGTYTLVSNVLGLQGNSTKEEWIELKLDVTVVNPERYTIGFLDVTTDKTVVRQVQSIGSRPFTAGMVCSLYMWASAGLGTFTVSGISFELHKILESSS